MRQLECSATRKKSYLLSSSFPSRDNCFSNDPLFLNFQRFKFHKMRFQRWKAVQEYITINKQVYGYGVCWVKGNYRQVELIPSPNFISKTQLAADVGALRPFTLSSLDELAGPEGKDDKLLCPLRTLCYYLKRYDEYRSSDQKKLIISHRRGMPKDITAHTISTYIKEAIVFGLCVIFSSHFSVGH